MKLILTLLAMMLVFSQPAVAHESLLDFSPAEGQVVAAGVIDIELQFSSDLLNLSGGSGSEIVVFGPAGAESELRNNGCAVITGSIASTSLELDIPGEYTVGWRVVSGDGHPIDGSHRFVVENNSGFVAQGDSLVTDCANPIQDIAESQTVQIIDYNYLWLLALLPIAAVGIFFLLRPKPKTEVGGQEESDS